ncbi:pilus assembly FimT family protein [Verrucomicrobium spinosum]|uniref:pilus assembly FimT family protein n=1 Tax=Verrucomicrobium spinosum TaxID=2736 RepID=UPI0009462617|nr:prepilin-type N-terminal cleavage/methylation domain-containing protein [Verrucomicrobium spinosum]
MRLLISPPVRRGPQGFTLLEISIVLFIMALLVGLCIYSFGGLTAERELRKPVMELQRMTMERSDAPRYRRNPRSSCLSPPVLPSVTGRIQTHPPER